MAILDDMSKLLEAIRSVDRSELADDIAGLIEHVRQMDRAEVRDEAVRVAGKVRERSEVLDEAARIAEKVRDVLRENHALRTRLKARLQATEEEISFPYEGVYWFDTPARGR